MDLKDLYIFERVAVVQNLTSVANALELSPGTVSKRIQALEDELGVRLIDRTTRSNRLTEEGRMLLQRVSLVLAEMETAKDEIAAHASAPAGRLTISAPAFLQRQLVNPALVSFANAYPKIEVRIDSTDRIVNLHEEGYDVAIRWGALPDSTLKARRLFTDRIVLAASPGYVERHGAPQRAADLERHSCLVHGDRRAWKLSRGGERTELRVTGRIASDSAEFLYLSALRGAGILRTSELAIADDLSTDRLVELLPDHTVESDASIWIVYPSTKHAMPRLRALVDHMSEYCRDNLVGSVRPGGDPALLKDARGAALRPPAPSLRRSRDV